MKEGCILLMRYSAALIQQLEPIFWLICATWGPVLSLRGGGGFVSEMPVVFNPKRCCIGFPRVSAISQTWVMQNVLSHADREIRQISFCSGFRKSPSEQLQTMCSMHYMFQVCACLILYIPKFLTEWQTDHPRSSHADDLSCALQNLIQICNPLVC